MSKRKDDRPPRRKAAPKKHGRGSAKRPTTRPHSPVEDDAHQQRLKSIRDDIDRALDEAALSRPAHQQYRAAAHEVLNRMAPRALECFCQNVRGFKFYRSHEALTDAYRRKHPQAKFKKIKGAFDPEGILHLDGGGILFGRETPIAEFYAHEAAHAIDGPDHRISGTAEWKNAWQNEIAVTELFGKNGASKPSEGFAEFGQFFLATPGLTRKKVREVLPRCLKVWETHGL